MNSAVQFKVEPLVSGPNSGEQNPQSEAKVTIKSQVKRRKSVRQIRNEMEASKLSPIRKFFGNDGQKSQNSKKNSSGESKPKRPNLETLEVGQPDYDNSQLQDKIF